MLICFGAGAQIYITSGSTLTLTPQQLVEGFLIGNGVTVSNATFNGMSVPFNTMGTVSCSGTFNKADQIGLFQTAGSATPMLQITSGIILSSGKVRDADRTVSPPTASTATCSGGDPDLTLIGGHPSLDKAVLEFDFIPQTDIISFRYVFASEEFDDICFQSFNDAFGFFLSAVNISGGQGYANDAVNIAFLPGTSPPVPVTTNNICATDNHVLNGTYSWWNGSGKEIPAFGVADGTIFSYDRFTHVFTATYPVTCNMVHHIKIALSDIMDKILDSGIFLEANSFSSSQLTPHLLFSNPLPGDNLIAGCNTVSLYYSIPQPRTTDLTVNLALDATGTATQADIQPDPFPTSVVIPAGALQTAPITIQAVAEPAGPDKSLVVRATLNNCGVPSNYLTTMTIKYNATLAVLLPTQSICAGSTATLSPAVSGGQPFAATGGYQYLWSTGASTPTIVVSPLPGSYSYSVTVTDACNQTTTAATTLTVSNIPAAPGNITGSTGICFPSAGNIYSVSPVAGADSYIWTLPAGGIITGPADGDVITVDFGVTSGSGYITVKGQSNACGAGPASALQVTLNPAPVVSVAPVQPVCLNVLPFMLTGSPPGGIFSGPGITGNLFDPTAAGAGTHTATYIYSGPGGCSGTGSGFIVVNPLPVVTLAALPVTCITAPAFMLTQGSPAGGTYTGAGVSSGLFTPSAAGIGIHPVTYSYTGPNNCTNTAVGNIQVEGLPDADFTGPVLPVTVCQDAPEPSLYQAAPNSTVTFTWTIPAPFSTQGMIIPVSGSPNMVQVNWNGTGAAKIKLAVLSGAGCQDTRTKDVFINPKPAVSLTACFDIITTVNARPFLLKGGNPIGSAGTYKIDGTPVPSGLLNPATLAPGNHVVTYAYTNVNGCQATDTKSITVGPSNAAFACSSAAFTDPRDNNPATNSYPAALITANGRTRCWMLKNLNWGTTVDNQILQTDNCLAERYCRTGDNNCLAYGALYLWDEAMQYGSTPDWPKGVCPPGWHIPTETEWQDLIDSYDGNGRAGSYLSDPNSTHSFDALLQGIFYLNNTWSFVSSGPLKGTLFWTSTINGDKPVARGINSRNFSVSRYESSKGNAFPVRCVKD